MATTAQPELKKVSKTYPKYKVLLHDDPVNTVEYVCGTLQRVVNLSEQDAMRCTMQVHTEGVSTVIVCDLEPAEHYCEGLKAKKLTSTLEKQ